MYESEAYHANLNRKMLILLLERLPCYLKAIHEITPNNTKPSLRAISCDFVDRS